MPSLVARIDNDGTVSAVRDGLDAAMDAALASEMAARGHKQAYLDVGYVEAADRARPLRGGD
jgi:hypothetical protein